MELVSTEVRACVEALAAPASDDAWSRARHAVEGVRAEEPELARLVGARDAEALRAVIAAWDSGKRLLPPHDREVLARAMKAFRKSLKVTRLAAESSISGGPMSAGRHSEILGIRPPERYPRAVWDEL